MNGPKEFTRSAAKGNCKGTMKMKFTAEEDALLIDLVNKNGAHDWRRIAAQVPNRNARQCRERYKNYLAPSITNSPWTLENDEQLKSLILQLGPQWSRITKSFPNRTDVFLKNRWVTIQRRDRRMEKKALKEKGNLSASLPTEQEPQILEQKTAFTQISEPIEETPQSDTEPLYNSLFQSIYEPQEDTYYITDWEFPFEF